MYVQMDGDKVRELRGERSTGEVAREAGITRSTLRRVERNGGPVLPDTARGIGRALEVDPRSIAQAVWAGRSAVGRPDVEAHELRV